MLTLILVSGFLILLVFVSLARKGGAGGIHLMSVDCPHCGTPTPRFCKPTSFRQAMLGGWTCQACGTDMDRQGRRLDKAA